MSENYSKTIFRKKQQRRLKQEYVIRRANDMAEEIEAMRKGILSETSNDPMFTNGRIEEILRGMDDARIGMRKVRNVLGELSQITNKGIWELITDEHFLSSKGE